MVEHFCQWARSCAKRFGGCMKRAFAVIGSNCGDEGKGLMVDHACAKYSADVVVRFNGGAQAGHTVVTPQGQRHVFSHFGSGSLLGVPTYLTRFFICNPILFCQELDRLETLGVKPKVYVDYECMVTTPYDMLLNQEIEKDRGRARHGSCGVGINETVQRHTAHPSFWLNAANLQDAAESASRISAIRSDYVPQRLGQLRMPADHMQDVFRSDELARDFFWATKRFMESVTLVGMDNQLGRAACRERV